MLGITLHMYKLLDTVLKVLKSPVKVEEWPARLGFQQAAYWQQFDGNQCKKLLENVDVLRRLLKPHREIYEDDTIKTIMMAFETFNDVRNACFGLYLDENYISHIREFGYNYSVLVNKMEKVDGITFNVILKVHILFCHVYQFLETQNDAKLEADPNWIKKGLGYWVIIYFVF